MQTERRKAITDLDTPEVKLARDHIELLGKMAEGDLVEKLLHRQDELVEAVLKMREISEHVLVSPDQTHHLSQALLIANKVLRDTVSGDEEVEEKTIFIEGIDTLIIDDEDVEEKSFTVFGDPDFKIDNNIEIIEISTDKASYCEEAEKLSDDDIP